MSHIMQSLPITRDGKMLTWVPGRTLLMYAAATGDPEKVNQVFRYDSDLEAQDSERRTAKDWAKSSGLGWRALLPATAENHPTARRVPKTCLNAPSDVGNWNLGLSPEFTQLPHISQVLKGRPDPSWVLPYPRTDDDPLDWVSAVLDSSCMGSQDIKPIVDLRGLQRGDDHLHLDRHPELEGHRQETDQGAPSLAAVLQMP